MKWLALSILLLASCGGGPRGRVATAVDAGDLEGALAAYEDYRRSEGADADVLGRVAALLLEEEARAEDGERRRAAILQLSLAGTAGEPALIRLSESEGITPGRLGALEVLARRGSEPAKLALRALADHDDPAVLASAIVGMDPALDRDLLLRHLESEDATVRRAAARALSAREDAGVREALAERARVDPDASVRAAAVGALALAGPAAVDALRERLGDPTSSVRLAAVGALARADEAAAREALGALLEMAPSPAGIEAARVLALLDGEIASTARAFLRRSLEARDAGLRSQAGVALTGLPASADAPVDAVRAALRTEADPEVRLSLARALWRRERATAAPVLEGLLADDGMPGVQAAALLAGEAHEEAIALLDRVARGDGVSVLRRTAARALAREAMRPDAARRHLDDDDPLVRIYAAGGILAAAAAS